MSIDIYDIDTPFSNSIIVANFIANKKILLQLSMTNNNL